MPFVSWSLLLSSEDSMHLLSSVNKLNLSSGDAIFHYFRKLVHCYLNISLEDSKSRPILFLKKVMTDQLPLQIPNLTIVDLQLTLSAHFVFDFCFVFNINLLHALLNFIKRENILHIFISNIFLPQFYRLLERSLMIIPVFISLSP